MITEPSSSSPSSFTSRKAPDITFKVLGTGAGAGQIVWDIRCRHRPKYCLFGGKKDLTLSGKIAIIPDTESTIHMLQHDAQQILARVYGYGRGNVFTPNNFLDLTSYENAQKSLTRLARQGKIRRLMRGVYEYPAYSKLLKGPASPNPDAIARAIARSHGWTILPSGNTALNLLGLSTQVPAKWEYFSDGPTKAYKWSGGTLAFKRRANKETTKLSPRTALLVQALKTLGEKNVTRSTMTTLRKKLSVTERRRAVREGRYVTSWVYERIKQLA